MLAAVDAFTRNPLEERIHIPEQAVGGVVTAQSDLYALGAMLYEMLTLQPPFDGGTDEVLAQVLRDAPASPRQEDARPRDNDAHERETYAPLASRRLTATLAAQPAKPKRFARQ